MLIRGITWLFSIDFDEGNSIENIVRTIIFNLLLCPISSFSFSYSNSGMLYIMGILLFIIQGVLLFTSLCMMASRG